ncbi:cytochrome P450 714C2 [Cannabis sativa]|uniref:cytochrome P450 714C2 n=1 Tax=Cannabis sativa TaxID=3483 RepID=UPI0029CA75D5|nr:cytochrome P450 714C2 [Cannabis sativa]
MGQFDEYSNIFMCVALMGMISLLVRLYKSLVANPRRLRSLMTKQGLTGPPPSFLLGNIMEIKNSKSAASRLSAALSAGESPLQHNCANILFPFFEKWRKQYGEVFIFSLGNTQILYVNEADMVREITTCTSLDLGKPLYQAKERGALLGQGILTSNGAVWAHQRKVLAPQLYMDKVKGMVSLITECATCLVDTWKNMVGGSSAEIKIDWYMRRFSGDVISKACFGSNYGKGEEIFQKLRSIQESLSKKMFLTGVPGMRYVPTKSNREVWGLEAEVGRLIIEVVKERKKVGLFGYEKDLLQMVMEGAENSNKQVIGEGEEARERFIVDNCKNIYLAGYETTAVSATWCLMLLAANQDWQHRVRQELLHHLSQTHTHTHTPINYHMLRNLKQLTMVINEALRLYPPVTVVSREAFKDMKFGDINVPKGVNVWIMVLTLHTDPEIWGPDSYKFNPNRFANGITGACKLPHLYMPFGMGPRVCLGQNLAMVELKLLLAFLLSNFSFALSPAYRHAPTLRLVVEPEHGVDLLVTKL